MSRPVHRNLDENDVADLILPVVCAFTVVGVAYDGGPDFRQLKLSPPNIHFRPSKFTPTSPIFTPCCGVCVIHAAGQKMGPPDSSIPAAPPCRSDHRAARAGCMNSSMTAIGCKSTSAAGAALHHERGRLD